MTLHMLPSSRTSCCRRRAAQQSPPPIAGPQRRRNTPTPPHGPVNRGPVNDAAAVGADGRPKLAYRAYGLHAASHRRLVKLPAVVDLHWD